MDASSYSPIRSKANSGQAEAVVQGKPWLRAAAWLAFLGPFFFLTYGFANWWTSRLGHVESIVFDWERKIPFLDWTILPYMSIDAFYALSLFLCTSRAELDTHAKRLLLATLISVTAFLVFPLQFSFERPATSGFNGALFDILAGFDKPFNQAPSLHISLLMLLWVLYARYLQRAWLWFLHGWFFLIGLSVFTTYQHHAIDGVTGFAVGVICLYLFPDRSTVDIPYVGQPYHRKVQWMYLGGAAVFAGAAFTFRGWSWVLLWPATALSIVGYAYTGYGAAVFQKHQGKLSWSARVLLAPYRLGAWLSSRWFTRRGAPSAEVIPGLWIGRAPGKRDWLHLDPRAVLDLTAEFNACPGSPARKVHSVPMLDLATPSRGQLDAAVSAIDLMYDRKPVLVHCALGYSRSALAIAAWLLHRGIASTSEQAIQRIRAARPQIVLPPSYVAALNAYANSD